MTKYRLISLGLFFFLGFGVVLFRAFQLQMLPADRVENLARRQLMHKVDIVGRRGVITDRNGRELAVSTNSLSIFANPKLIKKPIKAARVLASVLGVSEFSISQKIKDTGTRKFVWVARQLDAEQMSRLEKTDLKGIEGIGVLPEFRREFPQQILASHVLGFVSVDGQGLEGVEKQFNEILAGSKNTVTLTRDALGRPVFSHKEQIRLDLNQGSRLELTLDSRLQYSAEKALKEAIDFHQAESGSVIVMDPRNGEILALANYPTYDPNNAGENPIGFRRNRAITDPIEPGSVLKPFVVARAIEDHIVKPDTILPAGNGFIRVGNKVIGEADAKHRFSTISIVDLIRISSNVGTVVLKNRMGFPRIEDTYRKLGFGAVQGIELAGESKGIFNSPTENQLLEQATMSFGQGISLTPLQIATAYSTLANSGYRVKPHLVRRVVEAGGISSDVMTDGLGGEEFDPKKAERVFSESTTRQMRSLLEKVVEGEGTGIKARVEGFKVAGKTGTSQRVDYQHGGYERGSYWSSFSGFIPSDNPRYVITVLIDKPSRNGHFGGVVAAPVFAKIAQAAVRLSRSELQLSELGRASPEVQKIEKVAHARSAVNVSLGKSTVPELTGLPLSSAMRTLKMRGLSMELQGEGDSVADQIPAAGAPAGSTTKVYLKLR